MIKTLTALLFIFLSQHLQAQYTTNGSATRDNCHCYTLTQNITTQGGSVWNNNKINLTQSFNYSFDVFFGCSDGGADGIAFVLQPVSTSVGSTGSGMGFSGITPSVGVTMDTYQNQDTDNDPFYDHITLQTNGVTSHNAATNLTAAVPISATSNDVEDCRTHNLRVEWDATFFTLKVYFDGQQRITVVNDFTNTIFGGNPLVYWGFTGATGGLSNLQQFCTALAPSFHLLPAQKRCVGEAITFYDSTITFGGVLKRYWNFGDGSPLDSVNVNPVHTFTTAGDYTVILRVIGIDSCQEIQQQIIRVGSKPVAGFFNTDSCLYAPVNFTDTSRVAVGTINNWYWSLDNNGISSTLQNPSTLYTTAGIKNIKLAVRSLEGCLSDTLYKTIRVKDRPVSDFNMLDSTCLGSPTVITGFNTFTDGPVTTWNYLIDGIPYQQSSPVLTHTFLTPGVHSISLVTASSATGNAACASLVKQKNIFIADKPRAAIKFIIPCESKQVQLLDSSYSTDGIPVTSWWWDLGNGQFSTQQHPNVTYTSAGTKTIRLLVRNAKGCFSDTLTSTIVVAVKPVAKFGISEALCNNSLLALTDSSTITDGSITGWNWIYDNASIASTQNASYVFPAGNNTIRHAVTSNYGCVSDTVSRSFIIKTKPEIAMSFDDACKFALVDFDAVETPTNIGIVSWHWSFGDGSVATGNNITHAYTANRVYPVTLYAVSSEGCNSDTLKGNINIYGTNAFAGNDTLTAANQPFQLHASGGLSYEWTPVTGLSDATIANPVVTIANDISYYLKASTPEGCESFDTVNIKIYQGPDIYMPSAFTPNNDGLNDVFRGIPIGMKSFSFMKIYNRWGQELFSTTNYNRGWDGRWKGQPQDQAVYVVIAAGIDMFGKPFNKKSTVMLIR